MTTGVSIYLVSACTSGEQFVAAFRRYADKNGLFIPIASPIPAGRRGRFALTLSDGGVMIEGVADIVSAATTPSILHGRVGMTLRFSELDVASKTVLLELEQARLALKPQPPSVPPRPAAVPAEPRAKVPTPSGRVDANNARAECVAIGDIDALEQTVPQVPKPGGKFAIPSIPPVSGARTKAPSMVPTPKEIGPARPTKPTVPPVVRPQVPTPIDVSPARAPMHATPLSITAIDAPIVMPDEEPTQPPHLVRDAAANPTLDEELGPVPQVADAELFAGPTRDTETLAAAVPTDVPSDQPSGSGRVRRGGNTQSSGKLLRAATQIGLPIVQSKTPAQPSGAQPRPPVVADPTPSLAMPELSDEPTDVTSVPIVIPDGREDASTESSPVPGGGRKTVIGVAVVPEGVTVLPAIAAPISAPSLTAPPLASAPAVGAPVIEEPTGDWTMIPGEPPRILPRATARDEAAADEPTSPPVLPPTGNWTIAPVANSPDGWSEPSKVDLAPIRANVRSNVGPPVAMVSGEKALEVTSTAKHFDIEEETKAGVKI
ncbi:MAG TPA: hypothetical protein VK427_20090, partial [Kofleriaceae bacterium]|nr:hypothetical protein [Kofleriaceae bacterium]